MAKHRFPKPQPLSPRQKHIEEDGVLYHIKNGRRTKLRGVRYYDSIYYWWYQYLRCSERYRVACSKGGKGMQRIYKDFGDIFSYADTPTGFWDWWRHVDEGADQTRGERLFGIKAKLQTEMKDWLSLDDLDSLKAELKDGSVKLLAVPTNLNKTVVTRRFRKLIKPIKNTPRKLELAKYHPKSNKIDAVSLEKALLVWKMKFQQGMQHAAIAADLMENPRFAPRRRVDENGEFVAFDYDSRNTVIVRLWKKAQKNIEAVEQGVFPLGH